MNSTLFFLAFRNITRNKRRSAFTLCAIFFGITIVLMIKGIADGFITMTIDGVVKSRIGAIQIHKKGYGENLAGNPIGFHFEMTNELKSKIESQKYVTGIAPRVNFSGVISDGKNQTLFWGTGIHPALEKTVCPLSSSVIQWGQTLNQDDKGKVIVGEELASALGVSHETIDKGAMLTISSSSPDGRQNALDVLVKGAAIASNSLAEKRFISLLLEDAQELTGLGSEVTEVAVSVDQLEHINAVKDKLKDSLGPDFEVTDWQENQPFLRDIIFRQKIIISIISIVLFVLVLFLVANTMLMTVHERTREIGTMLALGVKQTQILLIFILESLSLGIIGGLLGVIAGIIVNAALAYRGIEFVAIFEKTLLRPEVSNSFVVFSFFSACLCTVLAGFIPALRASKLDPVIALRS